MHIFQRIHRHDTAHFAKGVSQTLTIKYDMAGIVSDVLNLKYRILGIVSNTLNMIYSIPISFVFNTLEIRYDSRQSLFLKKNIGDMIAMERITVGDMIA